MNDAAPTDRSQPDRALADVNPTYAAPPAPAPRRWVKPLVGLLIVFALAFVGRQYLADVDKLRHVSFRTALSIGLLFLLSRAVFGEILVVVLRRLGHAVSRVEAFYAVTIIVYASLVVPQAGLGASAAYVNARRRVPYADFGSALYAMNALQLFVVGLAGLAFLGLAWASDGAGGPAWVMAALFAGAAAGGAVLAFVRFPLRDAWRGPVASFVRRVNGSLDRIGLPAATVAWCVALQVATLLLRGVRLQLCYAAMGVPANFYGVMVSSLLADLTGALSVTPGSLGIREGAILYGAAAAGVDRTTAVNAALLDRMAWTVAVVVAAQIGLYTAMRGRRAA